MLASCTNILNNDLEDEPHGNDTKRKEIDNEICALQESIRTFHESIRALKTRRNALAPVGQFPAEILAQVFAYLLPNTFLRPWPDPVEERAEPYAWIAVTHVSRHWRNVALDTPTLWSVIRFQSAPWAHEMLRRSGSAPLSIRLGRGCGGRRDATKKAVTFALEHLARTHEFIQVFTIPDSWKGAFKAQLCQPAPALHSLYMSPGNDEEILHIPRNIFAQCTPLLQRVALRGCLVKWDTPLFDGLRELNILSPVRRPSWAELCQLLRRMPTLERLALKDALPPVPCHLQGEQQLSPSIQLSSLLFLSLEDFPGVCAVFLGRLSYQDQTAIHLRCQSSGEFACLSPFLENIRNGDGPGVEKLVSLCLGHFGGYGLHVQAWDNFERVGSPFLDVELHWPRFSHDVAPVGEVLRALPLEGLQYLSSQISLTVQLWKAVFGSLSRLKSINLRNCNATPLVIALAVERDQNAIAPSSPRGDGSQISALFLNLRNLTLTSVAFGFGALNEGQLRGLSSQRSYLNIGLEILELDDCHHLHAKTVSALKTILKPDSCRIIPVSDRMNAA